MGFEGQLLGRYRLQRVIGRGGVGDVYSAEDERISRQVAVKIVQTKYLSNEEAEETARLFAREARTIAMLNHPHILPLFDFGEELIDSIRVAYLVTPLCEGSLSTWVRQHNVKGILTPDELAPLLQQAADALSYAHAKGIVHRDVKPSNFLVRSLNAIPDLLLADFGVARFTQGTINVSQTVRGTPSYMSPEQWSGTSGPAADQYSLAIVAYELLTGRLPFQGDQHQMMFHHNMTQPTLPSAVNRNLSSSIDAVILHALAKQPATRFASIVEFAQAFNNVVSQEKSISEGNHSSIPNDIRETRKNLPEQAVEVGIEKNTPDLSIMRTNDIRTTLKISLTDATIGADHSVLLPNGQLVNVSIPPGVRDGQEIRLEKQVEPSSPNVEKKDLVVQLEVAPNNSQPIIQALPGVRPSPFQLKTLLPAGLVVMILLASVVTLFSFGGGFPLTNAAQATAAASRATLQALNGTYTAATATANIDATATAQLDATAAITYNPYDSNLKTLTLHDSLNKNSTSKWDETSGACQFKTDGYYVVNPSQAIPTRACIARNTTFGSVAFEVQMTLLKGFAGGILLYSSHGTSYYFGIHLDRTYTVSACTSNTCQTVLSGYSSWILPGLNQPNLVAIAENANGITISANKYYINSINDKISFHGSVGVIVEPGSEAVFSQARAWTT